MMMMKSVFWWRKPEYTDLRQVTDETFHTYGLYPVRGLNLGHSGVKQSELRRDESDALAHRATMVPDKIYKDIAAEVNAMGVAKMSLQSIKDKWQTLKKNVINI